ncbi:hypothetical protein EZS27_012710 [termite gut metagenome]|jgi:hypothetical protein|uniref:DUF3853 family protein n=5 Tax=termite gut metagenome TaxID=433724 RepID=A0A5J4S1Q9_9ZZZZ
MNIHELKEKPLWQMTGEEFLFLQQNSEHKETQPVTLNDTSKRYVYGISGIARLFGCSIPTANRIKQSGKIDKAITQIGRKIIVEAELALELAGRKQGGRR